MSNAVIITAPVDPDVQRLRAQRDEAMAALEDQQQNFVLAFVQTGNATEAARTAGYADAPKTALRLKRSTYVKAAIAAVLRCRTAEQEFTRDDAIRFLREMLAVRLEDVCDLNERGVVVGLRDPSSLPTAVTARLKRAFIHVHASATGERAHYRKVELEFHSPMEALDRVSRLEGWVESDAPAFRVLLQQAAEPVRNPSLEVLHHVAADLLDGPEALAYIDAHVAGDTETQIRLLREGAARLRRIRDSIPAEVVG